MSIASEITRLQQAKADIKTAIENKGVTVPSSATLDAYDGYIDDIPSGGGGNWESAYRALIGDSTPTEVIIPEGITTIRKRLFTTYTNLVRCVIPNSVVMTTSYGDNSAQGMFDGCTNLQEVVIGSGFTKTSERMFNNCTSLQSITLPASITQINAWTFSGCTNLTTVILERTESIVINNYNEIGAPNAIFYVPDALLDTYKTANRWSNIANRIKPMSELPTT